MTVNVGQALLKNAEQGKLKGAGQAAQVFGCVQAGLNAATFREALHVPFCGRCKTGFVEQWRMQ
jgi:hypothetical protein